MTGGRRKRRKTTNEGTDAGSGVVEKSKTSSRSSADEVSYDAQTLESGVDAYAQARKALTERCPFGGEEASSRVGTLPSVLAVHLQRQSDGRRRHRKVQEGAGVKAVGPGRPSIVRSVWEETEEYFRPITLDDIDLLDQQLPSASCFYIPSSEKVEEAVPGDSSSREMDVSARVEVVKEFTENMKEEAYVAETDSELACSSAWPVQESLVGDEKSLNWILGSKQRSLLSTERSSKKTKLIGEDAGLENLMLLPHGEGTDAALPFCDFCCLGESDVNSNRLLFCDSCKVSVHQKCYGVHELPAGGWMCSWCKHLDALGIKSEAYGDDKDSCLKPCLLCPKAGGALKPVAANVQGSEDKRFVHLFCSLWTPEVYVEDVGVMEPIMNIGGIRETRKKLVCNLCKVKHGVCVRCSYGKCRTSFHPICAREAKHQMEIWGQFAQNNLELRAFCLKHSSVRLIDDIPSTEHSSRITNDDLLVGKLLPSTLPVKGLPKIRFSRKIKDKSMLLDAAISSASVEVSKNDACLDQESSALKLRLEEEVTQVNQMADSGFPDDGNVLPNTSDVIKIFRKIIVRRKINVDDVALELGVSSALLESAMAGDDTSFPSDLRVKVIQWLQNVVHVQPSTLHLKLRNGSAVLSDGLINSVGGRSASLLHGSNAQGTINRPAVDHIVKTQRPHRTRRHKHSSCDDNVLSSTGEALYQDRTREQVDQDVDVRTGLANCIYMDANVCVPSSHIEDPSLKEHCASQMILENIVAFPDSATSEDLLLEDMPEGSILKESSDCSRLALESGQIFEVNVNDPKSNNVVHPEYDPCVSACPVVKDVGSYHGSYVHPFILKKMNELQNQWHFPQKHGTVEADSNDRHSTSIPGKFDCLAKASSAKTLDLLPADEVEGELLYLQYWLLNSASSIKHSCEELIYRIVQHLPEEIDAFRKKRLDTVLVNQHLSELKEAKKRGRKERKHIEAQAILAAATAAASAARNSLLRRDANEGVSSSHQQNLLKISTASDRASAQPPLVLRLKEAPSRSSIAKMSSDKHSGNFKLPDFAKENVLFCDICWKKETIANRIFICSICKVAVHLDCYRKLKDPTGPWRCELCEDMSFKGTSPRTQQLDSSEKYHSRAQCSLCCGGAGAFRKSIDGEWVHAFCAEWLLESVYKRGQQNLIEMGSISKEKDLSTCSICHYRVGLCLKCSYGHCQSTFHPTCARSAGLFMNIKTTGGRLQHKAYCEKHSAEQREKADCLLGVEELKNLKQARVDLEKVRLLCERIIKREKVKRELLICSHGIISLRRNCVALSAAAQNNSSFGISSESATTSIDNRSYSGAIQRSDDVTVDSTISGKRNKYQLPLDFDPRTDDSSTSQMSFKRKMSDRTVFSGKRLPQIPASASRNSAFGGEKRSKPHQGIEFLQQEKVTTSYQASLQNQRLPKGYIYVPCGSLEKDSLPSHESNGLT